MSLRRLNSVVVSASLPHPPSWGFARRVFHLVEELAGRHAVTFVRYAIPNHSEDAIAQFRTRVSRVVAVPRVEDSRPGKRFRQLGSIPSRTPFLVNQVRERSLERAVDQTMGQGGVHIAILESSQLGWLRTPRHVPTVIDEHNIESEVFARMASCESRRLRRQFYGFQDRRYRHFERSVWARADGCATTSRRHAGVITASFPALPVEEAPNGVDPLELTPSGAPPDRNCTVFTGLLRYRPNLDGIQWFLSEIYPRIRRARPDAAVTIVGDGTPRRP